MLGRIAFLALFAALPAFAGTAPATPSAPGPAVMPDRPWQGAQIGLWFGSLAGSIGNPFATADFNGGPVQGAHIGYDWQRDNLVYGAEISLNRASDGSVEKAPGPGLGTIYGVSARLGFAFNPKVMVYGRIGGNQSTFQSTLSRNFQALSTGFGAEYRFDRHWSVAGEVTHYWSHSDEFYGAWMRPVVTTARVVYRF